MQIKTIVTQYGKYLFFWDEEKREAIVSSLNGWVYSYISEPLLGRGYWDKVAALISIIRPKKILILGLSGGTIALIVKKYISDKIKVVGVEIDGELIDNIKPYFNDLNHVDKVVISDAFEYVQKTRESFDAIIIDIYLNDRIPDKFKDKKFFQLLKKRLNKEGFVICNIIDTELKNFRKNLNKEFENVKVFKSGQYNYIILAGNRKIRLGEKSLEKVVQKLIQNERN